MSCNKIKATCTGVKTWAVCVQTELTVNEASSLINEDCQNTNENLQDIYDQLEGMSTEGLGELCLTYTLEEGKILVKNVLNKFEQEICDLKTKVEQLENREICDMPIGDCVDLKCLTDACNNSITTYGEFFQALVDNACPTP